MGFMPPLKCSIRSSSSTDGICFVISARRPGSSPTSASVTTNVCSARGVNLIAYGLKDSPDRSPRAGQSLRGYSDSYTENMISRNTYNTIWIDEVPSRISVYSSGNLRVALPNASSVVTRQGSGPAFRYRGTDALQVKGSNLVCGAVTKVIAYGS
jgi:hypothetical protein